MNISCARNQAAALITAEREELARLRMATDRFVFRRSYALAFLKWREYALLIPEN